MSRPANENSTDICAACNTDLDTCETIWAACDTDLATCETIWAAEGKLYCSRACGINDFMHAYGDDAEKHFDEVAEEINPRDIGIGTDYVKCELCSEWYQESELKETDRGFLCDHCIKVIRSHGEDIEFE